ncbi:uncharacterized protein BJ212DRAFT_1299975 [Suillus subaureus]|uniref:Uncharacterized protein n=1 Tax=Suillus subaureus TaxID=48587 RepID=A0A9P7EB85_9AGAM|nr:uncharacterized protein BJ212DRAFT_1299975 [Suillus subaureus]KAG1816161.1 hypothetical protein BJ212DRAFT_1299975 [Suillus subaureus]
MCASLRFSDGQGSVIARATTSIMMVVLLREYITDGSTLTWEPRDTRRVLISLLDIRCVSTKNVVEKLSTKRGLALQYPAEHFMHKVSGRNGVSYRHRQLVEEKYVDDEGRLLWTCQVDGADCDWKSVTVTSSRELSATTPTSSDHKDVNSH